MGWKFPFHSGISTFDPPPFPYPSRRTRKKPHAAFQAHFHPDFGRMSHHVYSAELPGRRDTIPVLAFGYVPVPVSIPTLWQWRFNRLDSTRVEMIPPHFLSRAMLPVVLFLQLGLTGCLSPFTLERSVMAYDQSVTNVLTEQLLLNIPRAHHHAIHFTGVSNIAATFDFLVNTGATLTIKIPRASLIIKPGFRS